MMGRKQEMERKAKMESFSCLLDFGGFIEETAKDEILNLYSDQVVDILLADEQFQASYLVIAEKLEDLIKERSLYLYRRSPSLLEILDDEKNNGSEDGDRYAEWFLNKVYFSERERLVSRTKPFWSDFRLGRRDRKALEGLSAFEEHLLFLLQGIDRGRARSVEEVGVLDEFAGDAEQIIRCCGIMEQFLKQENLDAENFSEQCVSIKETEE